MQWLELLNNFFPVFFCQLEDGMAWATKQKICAMSSSRFSLIIISVTLSWRNSTVGLWAHVAATENDSISLLRGSRPSTRRWRRRIKPGRRSSNICRFYWRHARPAFFVAASGRLAAWTRLRPRDDDGWPATTRSAAVLQSRSRQSRRRQGWLWKLEHRVRWADVDECVAVWRLLTSVPRSPTDVGSDDAVEHCAAVRSSHSPDVALSSAVPSSPLSEQR